MARYIDVDKFAEAICNFSAIDENTANAMIVLLRRQPAADVEEVVKCKDCIHKFNIEGRCMCNINAEEAFGKWFGLRATHSENFCGYGERRYENG